MQSRSRKVPLYKRANRNNNHSVKRRPSPHKQSNTRIRGVTGYGDDLRVTLQYTEKVVRNPGTYEDTYLFRGNSVYDPNQTGTGQQPNGFDFYTQAYSKYKVLGSRIQIDFVNTTNTAAAQFVLCPISNIVAFSSVGNINDLPRSKMTKFLPVSTRSPVRIANKFSTRTVLGLRSGQVNDEDYSGNASSNPSSQWYWGIYGVSSDSATNLTYQMTVQIMYDVVFCDRKELSDAYKKFQITPDVPHSREVKEQQITAEKAEPQVVYSAVKVLL